MDRLARLRSDMDDAGREARRCGEDVTTACLDIFDEFSAGREVVEALMCEGSGGELRWLRLRDRSGPLRNPLKQPTQVIIVPRERKPSLLEAAEGMEHACSNVVIHSGRGKDVDEFHAAQRVLSEAIEKEKSNA